MAIGRTQETRKQDEVKVNIIEKITAPVAIASKDFYRTNPKEFLELLLIACFLTLTFVGEIVTHLSWGWYLAFSMLFVGYYNIPAQLKALITKKRKK